MIFHDVLLLAYMSSGGSMYGIAGGFIALILFFVLPLWLLCRKLGVNPWLSLLLFVPGGILFIFWVLYLIVDKRRKY